MNFNRFDVKTIKTFELGRKTTKVIKLQWIASIWRQNDQNFWVTSLNYKRNQITMNCMDLMSKLSEMLSYVAKHSKQRKTTKVIKLQWIASIWCQKHQTNAKLQKWSYFDEFQSIWRQNYQNIWVRSQNYKSNQITMDCIDLTSKRSKLLSYVPKLQSNRITINCIDLMPKRSRMLSYVAKHSKQRKTTKVIKLQWIASIWRQNDHNNAKLRKWSNYNAIDLTSKRSKLLSYVPKLQSNRITINCIDLTSKRSRMLSYVAKHSKQRKTTKVIKLQWIASIWRQNDHNNAKLRKWSNYNALHRFDVKTIKNVEVRRKTFKTTQNYKWNQITMNCMDLMSKLSEMLSYVAKHSKQRKTTKVIKLQWIASIWCQKHQTNAKLQKWSYFDEFQSIWRQNYQNIWVRSQNYKSNQITMDCIDLTSKRSKLLSYVPKLQSNRITINCIDLMPKRSRMLSYVAKHSKQRKTTKVIKLQWIASIWRQNDHNNAKLRKWSNYNALHRFDVKTIKNVEVRRKTFKTTQNYKWNQITMNLHRFDIRTI